MFDIHKIGGAAYAIRVDGDAFYFADVNQACMAMTGLTAGFHPGLTPEDVFPAAVAEGILQRYRACVATRQSLSYVSEAAMPSGQRAWRTTLFPVIDESGCVGSIIGICGAPGEDATDDKLSLNAKALMAMETIDGGFWIYEAADETFETSRSLAELLAGPGHSKLNLAEYISFIHTDDLGVTMVQDMDNDHSVVEYRVFTFDGRKLWLRSRRRILRDAKGALLRVVGVVTEITQQKRAFETLQTEASTDALTSVKNRRAFDRLAAAAFQENRTDGQPLGVMLIDLDHFKPINDRFGHRAGDEVLRKVARRISRLMRKSDCLARLGGDEFAILMHGASATLAEPLATRLRQAFAKPFMLGSDPVFIGISTGTGIATAGDRSITEVIERADHALYAMKETRQLKTA